jgi:hypothetical protein
MINYEIKSQLAKLLATENMVVENRNVETAQFDVEKRVLTLPMWKRASNVVYDMLVGHEVGHALFTPNEWDWEDRVPKQFVNVVEDTRIEKLMKRRYPGLSKSFYKGYQELSENDFFELEDNDISTYNLADRANLWFKIGNFVDVPIADEEQKYIEMMKETETFADTVMVAEELYKYCKIQQEKEKTQAISLPNPSQGKTEGQSESGNDESDETSQEQIQPENTLGESVDAPNSNNDNLEVQTDEIFENGTQEFNGNLTPGSRPLSYLEIPKVDIEDIIVKNNEVHKELEDHWIDLSTPREYYCSYTKQTKMTRPKDFSAPDNEYQKFKKSAQKEVNYLVKEFECKKSADAYSRSFTSKTGTLDCTKLHTYKFNEDLFKKVNIIPDGKNHGLIFILDWSGSMSDCMIETTKQLFNLVWFCNKVNIPFDVYAFTNSYFNNNKGYRSYVDDAVQEVKEYDFIVSPDFSLLHFFTSDVNKKELEKQMQSMWRLVWGQCRWVDYQIPNGYSLSGTPLNEAIVCLHSIIPLFQQKNRTQKVNVVILTDGEANVLPYYKKGYYSNEDSMGSSRVYPGDYVRNRKTGYTYKIECEYYKFTEILLNNLKQTFPEVNTVGFRLASNTDFKSFVRRYDKTMTEESYKKIKKEKSVSIKTSGYTSYFGILSSSLDNDTEFDVEVGATKAKIKSAFTKNLANKSLNRKVLNQFVDIIS